MSSQDEIAVISVNGRLYRSWTAVRVTHTYGSDHGSDFQVEGIEPINAPNLNSTDWRIVPGDRCSVTLAGILAFTGHVYVRHASFKAEIMGVKITGRSLGADAVDSSAPVKGGSYKGYTFTAIATALAKSVGVNLIVRGSSPLLALPFPNFSIGYGESVFGAIARLAQMRGLHLTDDANGNLVAEVYDPNIAAAGQLVEGKNLVEAYAVIDHSNAFSIITAASQRPGNDQVWGDAARDNSATATNPNIRAGRQRLLVSPEPCSSQDCAAIANYAAAYGGADLVEVRAVVQGWQSSPGALWDVGKNYTVTSRILNLDRVLVAHEVVYIQDNQGTRTEIALCTRESLLFAGGAVITPNAIPGEPAYSDTVPPQPAVPNQPDN